MLNHESIDAINVKRLGARCGNGASQHVQAAWAGEIVRKVVLPQISPSESENRFTATARDGNRGLKTVCESCRQRPSTKTESYYTPDHSCVQLFFGSLNLQAERPRLLITAATATSITLPFD